MFYFDLHASIIGSVQLLIGTHTLFRGLRVAVGLCMVATHRLYWIIIFPIFSVVVLFRIVRGKVNIGDKVNINEIKCSGSKLIKAIRIVISGFTVAIIPLFNRCDPLKEWILYFLLNIIISEEFLKWNMQRNSVEKMTSTRLFKTYVEKLDNTNYYLGVTRECPRVQFSINSKR